MATLERIVVVGGGLAGLSAVETLREEGFGGEITLLGDELHPPYDRPPLSKAALLGTREFESLRLRAPEMLAELGVETRLGVAARALDVDARLVLCAEEAIGFDGLILASGARARTLPLLDGRRGVHVLRTLDDAVALRDALGRAEHLIVIGAGFLGGEVAATARQLGLAVTIVELDEAPLARALGDDVGAALIRLHGTNGTQLRLGASVVEVGEGEPIDLRLSDGTRLEADLVVVAVGAAPNVEWLEGSGLTLENGVVVDAALNAGPPSVFAVGDIANWPNGLFGRRMRVEHWTNALEQGSHAARNLLAGAREPFLGSNYVWSDLYGSRVQFAGSAAAEEVVVVDGSLAEGPCLVWYREGDRIVGAFGLDMVKAMTRSRKLITQRTCWEDALATLVAS